MLVLRMRSFRAVLSKKEDDLISLTILAVLRVSSTGLLESRAALICSRSAYLLP